MQLNAKIDTDSRPLFHTKADFLSISSFKHLTLQPVAAPALVTFISLRIVPRWRDIERQLEVGNGLPWKRTRLPCST